MNSVLTEFVFSLRRLRASWQFSAIVVATLALGIGATCSIFSAVNAVLIHPLPYADPERLHFFRETFGTLTGSASWLNYQDWRKRNKTFSEIGIVYVDGANLTTGDVPERPRTAFISASMLRVLGVPAFRGRLLNEADESGEHPQALVLSYPYWQQHFHGDESVVGRKVTLEGFPARIVGVLPESFRFPIFTNPAEIFIPLIVPLQIRMQRGFHTFICIGRRKPHITPDQAQQDISRVARELATEYPDQQKDRGVALSSVPEVATQGLRSRLILLFAAVLCLLLISCVNVANLMLSRASVRRREFSIRMALGAGRARLAWQFLSEGLLLALAGGIPGLLLGFIGLEVMISLAPSVSYARRFALDPVVFVFAASLTLLAGVLPSLAPLWQILRSDPNEFLREGARSTPERSTRRLRNGLVIAETAAAYVLLTGAILLLNSFFRLSHVDSGLDTRGVVTASISLPDTGDQNAGHLFFTRLMEKIRAVPGVRIVGAVSMIPLRDSYSNFYLYIDGLSTDKLRLIEDRTVAGDYFQSVGIRLQRGRFFGPQDGIKTEKVLIFNQAAVAQFFPKGRDALGALVRTDLAPDAAPYRIVGIVSDYRNYGLDKPPYPEMYRPFGQVDRAGLKLTVRTDTGADSTNVVPSIRNALREIDPSIPLYDIATMDSVVGATLTGQRFETMLLSTFAISALLLGSIGMYAVMAYVVGQKTREIGVRMALGASHEATFRQTTAEAMQLAAIGLVIGIALAAALSKLVTNFLFHVPALDPPSYALAALLLGAMAFAAAAGPARWASRVDPAVTLRQEGTQLQLLPRRMPKTPPPNTAEAQVEAALERTFVTGVARVARRSKDWDDLFTSVTAFIAEACAVESVTLLEANGDGTFHSADHRIAVDASAFVPRRLRRIDGVLPLSEDDFVVWEHALAGDSWQKRSTEVATLRRMRARLAVPIRNATDLTGMLILGPSTSRQSAPPAGPLLVLAGQLGLLLENNRLSRSAAEAASLRRELDLAIDVQRRLLPARPPALDGVRVAGLCRPALGVGGDYFDYFLLPNGHLAITLADVAGKGMAAALVVSLLYSALRTLAPKAQGDIAGMVGELNRLLQRATQPRAFATLFYGEYDPAAGTLVYCNAAHMPPLLRRNGEVTRLPGGGKVVGMFAKMEYQQHTAQLQPGDRLVIYSDGVTESPDKAGEDFGEDQLKLQVCALNGDAAHDAEAIADSVSAWSGASEPFDDVTVMILDVAASN